MWQLIDTAVQRRENTAKRASGGAIIFFSPQSSFHDNDFVFRCSVTEGVRHGRQTVQCYSIGTSTGRIRENAENELDVKQSFISDIF
jgi:hypothetical protein